MSIVSCNNKSHYAGFRRFDEQGNAYVVGMLDAKRHKLPTFGLVWIIGFMQTITGIKGK